MQFWNKYASALFAKRGKLGQNIVPNSELYFDTKEKLLEDLKNNPDRIQLLGAAKRGSGLGFVFAGAAEPGGNYPVPHIW